MCGDYNITVNPVLETDHYPVPRIEDILNSFSKCDKSSKVNLRQAYQQVLLDENSRKCVTVSTHKGLFQYSRIPFGASSGPGIFQRLMEQLLVDIEVSVVFLDDILVTADNDEKHLEDSPKCLKDCMQQTCDYNQSNHEGSTVDMYEIKMLYTQHQQKSRLSWKHQYLQILINYYASIAFPLYKLLRKGTSWKMSKYCLEAIKRFNEIMVSAEVLAHYDPSLGMTVACDASPYGVGVVLSQVYLEKTEKPIAFVSHNLTKGDINYSQIEKENIKMFGSEWHNNVDALSWVPLSQDVSEPLLGAIDDGDSTSLQ
ncbi:hypothetical protein PR048_005333 [Dryococelus australis]|uniref:Reverse transcriptase domain-containing protein n=1 Tax=Dryococelus australis TaxID=614101 RepID=A0ABQ9I7W6_9NEOP|nr:hypothetical protein PR048_005333 [Dryococelus australis]